jgi:hypothetical protein
VIYIYKGKEIIVNHDNLRTLIFYATCFGSPIKEPSSGSKTQIKNYTCVTPYLVSLLLASRSQLAYDNIYMT